MGFRGRLEITDGTTFIDLLGNSGGSMSIFGLLEWEPAAPDVKSGGIWMDNPLLDGRQLAIRKEGNIIETFSLVAKGQTANDVHNAITKLRYMLNLAVGYWTNRARYPTPIYLLIQYPEETTPYWALIYDYRIPQLTNPYVQPLYGKKVAIIPEFTLVIERGLRSPTIGLECADLDFEKTWIAKVQEITEPTGNTDDCEVNLTAGTIDLTSASGYFGIVSASRRGLGIRFINVAVPAGAVILGAYFRLIPTLTLSDTPPAITISGELDVAPAVFSTYANYIARVRTVAQIRASENNYDTSWQNSVIVDVPLTHNITTVIQEIIDLPGWASGNDLVLFIEPEIGTANYRRIAMRDHASYQEPKLYIDYYLNHEEQIIDQNNCALLPITNQMKYNQIETIFSYRADTGVYTTLSGTAMPWSLIPIVQVNSAVYFACNLLLAGAGLRSTFYALVLNLSAVFADTITIAWEYYNGAAWVAVVDLVDGTNGMLALGQSVVHWTPQTNWTQVAINGTTAYWIRARISVVGGASATTPIHDDVNEILTPGYPYLDIAGLPTSETKIPVKFTATPIGSGDDDEINYTVDEIWLATRNVNRGEDFTPYLNITDNTLQMPSGITISAAAVANLNNACIPSVGRDNPAGVVAETDFFTFIFDNNAAGKYAGSYRVFLRRYGVTTPENLSYRLQLAVDIGGTLSVQYQTGLIPDTDVTGYILVDFGTLIIPEGLQSFYLNIRSEAAGAADVYLTDLILLPSDEMLIHVYQRQGADVVTWVQVYNNYKIVIDGTGNTLQAWIESGGSVVLPLQVEANTALELDPLEDYRFWIFAGTYVGDVSSALDYQRQYWPGLDLSVTMQLLLKKI